MLPGALAIVAILLCEGLLLVRSYGNKYNYKADGDQMLFAYGVANLAAGFSGTLITGNSPSRSAAMDSAGARSQLPSLVAAGTILLVMLFFTDLLAYLPNAALAGIVANAVLSLIEVHEFQELWRVRRSEFWIASRLLSQRAGPGSVARRRHRLSHGHDRLAAPRLPPGHDGAEGGTGRQSFRRWMKSTPLTRRA